MDLLKEMEDNFPFRKESYKIIGFAMKVHSELGNGFLEAVYQEAFSVVLKKENIPFEQEKVIDIFFMGEKLNKKYIADFICYDQIIVETKAVKELSNNHYAQVLNYLKATNMKIGLLINFGSESLEYKRIIR